MADITRNDKYARQLKLLSQTSASGRLGPVGQLVNIPAPAGIVHLLESLSP